MRTQEWIIIGRMDQIKRMEQKGSYIMEHTGWTWEDESLTSIQKQTERKEKQNR